MELGENLGLNFGLWPLQVHVRFLHPGHIFQSQLLRPILLASKLFVFIASRDWRRKWFSGKWITRSWVASPTTPVRIA